MTSFLFQLQFSQRISQFSTSKFIKILGQHIWFFVPKKCLILGPNLSLLDQIFVMWRCSMPFFIHYMLTFLICLDAAYLLNFCKVCQLIFILSGVFFFRELNPRSLSYQVLFLFSFVNGLCLFRICLFFLELTQKFATVFIKYWYWYQVLVLQKKCSLKVFATVFILSGFVVAIQVLQRVVVWYL